MKRKFIGYVCMLLGVMLLSTSVSQAADKTLVREVQQQLILLGYQPGTADGVAGAKTSQAIGQFQRDNQLPQNPEITPGLKSVLSNAVAIQKYRNQATTEPQVATEPVTAGTEKVAPSTRYRERIAQQQAQQADEKPATEDSGFFSGLANLSRHLTSGFTGQKNKPSQRHATTATIGIRGLGADDLKTAHADLRALKKLDSYRSDSQQAARHAAEAGLQTREVNYLEEEKKGFKKWLP